MRFIIAYKLKRKNARRKVYAKIECIDQHEAVKLFASHCKRHSMVPDEKPRQWELLTGDWKHITFYEGKE